MVWTNEGNIINISRYDDECLIDNDIRPLEKDVNILKTDVNILKEDVDDLKPRVDTLEEDVDGLKPRVGNLEDTKVDKEEGKGLSTENYTTEEKNKLEAIELVGVETTMPYEKRVLKYEKNLKCVCVSRHSTIFRACLLLFFLMLLYS